MNDSFDPYHRWLSIPPKHQPADHYRLLAIERFENDPEVIRDAAERQISHVRRYELGQHAQLAQQILTELARAKACLLNADAKATYDQELQASDSLALSTPQNDAQIPDDDADAGEEDVALQQLMDAVGSNESASSSKRANPGHGRHRRNPRSGVVPTSRKTAGTKKRPPPVPAAPVVLRDADESADASLDELFKSTRPNARPKTRDTRSLSVVSTGPAALALQKNRETKRWFADRRFIGASASIIGAALFITLAIGLSLPNTETEPATGVNENTAESEPTFKFRAINVKEVIPGTEVRFKATAAGMSGESEGTLYRLTSAPSRAKIYPVSGQFHWQSHQEDAGRSYKVQLSAVSRNNEVAEVAFSIKVREQDFDHWVDVLSLVNPSQGSQWTRDGEGLKSKYLADTQYDIPFSISGSYDLYVVFRKLYGKDGPKIGVPVGSRFTTVMIQAWPLNGGYSYLARVDGLLPRDNRQSSRGIVLKDGQDHTLRIEIRQLSVDRGRVRTLLDEKELFVWQGQLGSLGDWKRTTLFVGTNWAPHLFKELRLLPVKD